MSVQYLCVQSQKQVSVSVSTQDGITALEEIYVLSSLPCSSLLSLSSNHTNIGLAVNRQLLTLEGEMSAIFFHSPLFFPSGKQCCDVLVYVQKVPQASQHFCLVEW